MTRPTSVFKDNQEAAVAWAHAYAAIPKSVFALAAWHLANVMSGTADVPGAAETTFLNELEALMKNGLISASQYKRARAALRKTETS